MKAAFGWLAFSLGLIAVLIAITFISTVLAEPNTRILGTPPEIIVDEDLSLEYIPGGIIEIDNTRIKLRKVIILSIPLILGLLLMVGGFKASRRKQPKLTFCPDCETSYRANYKFCGTCGRKLK